MAKRAATFELALPPRDPRISAHRWLYSALRAAILEGRLHPGTRLWTYNPAYVTGVNIPFQMPIEEVLFFLVIPLCALLTYNAVSAILNRFNRR